MTDMIWFRSRSMNTVAMRFAINLIMNIPSPRQLFGQQEDNQREELGKTHAIKK